MLDRPFEQLLPTSRNSEFREAIIRELNNSNSANVLRVREAMKLQSSPQTAQYHSCV